MNLKKKASIIKDNIGTIKIITLIILGISVFSCKSNDEKENAGNGAIIIPKKKLKNNYFGLSKSDLLLKLENDIDKKQTNQNFYNALDSIGSIVDGADAEHYLEIYAKSLIRDCNNLKKYSKKRNIDINVITFFAKSTSYSKDIAKSIKTCKLHKGRKFRIQDSDGYANLREEAEISSFIIKRINNDEEVRAIYGNDNDWKAIITSDNLIGFIHSSRLKLVKK